MNDFYITLPNVDLKKIDWLTVFIYIVLIIVVIYAIHAEIKDVTCQDTKGEICGPLTGRAYSHGKPQPGDSFDILLDKVKITSRYEMNSIHWRRAFIASVIASFIILYILNNKLPNGINLITVFLVIYIVFYLTLTLFQRWVTEPALEQMNEVIYALDELY